MDEGFIFIYRKYFNSPFWKEKRVFSKAEALLDLIQSANWGHSTVLVNMHEINIPRGHLPYSLRSLAKRWGWNKNKVAGFLDLLEKRDTLVKKTGQGVPLLFLVNYQSYQSGQKNRDRVSRKNGTRSGQGRDTPPIEKKTDSQLQTAQKQIKTNKKQQTENVVVGGLKKEQTLELINQFGVDKVKQAKKVLEETVRNSNVRNPMGFMKKACQNEWKSAQEAIEEESTNRRKQEERETKKVFKQLEKAKKSKDPEYSRKQAKKIVAMLSEKFDATKC